MKTVIDAVNELKGEWVNVQLHSGRWYINQVDALSHEGGQVCTRQKFLATVAECETNFGKCKQSYSGYKSNFKGVHTDRLMLIQPTKDLDKELDMDIDWSTTEYNFALVNSLNNIVEFLEFKPRLTDDNECYTTNVTEKLYYVGPWAVAEKSQPILPTLTYTQAMYDSGVEVEAGMRFATEAGEYIAEYTNKKSVVFTDEDGFLITVTRRRAKPIDIRTDKEKAIDDISNEFLKGGNTFRSVLEAAYDKWVG